MKYKSGILNWADGSAVASRVESDLQMEGRISFTSSLYSLTYSTNCKIQIFAHDEGFSRFRKV